MIGSTKRGCTSSPEQESSARVIQEVTDIEKLKNSQI
jgi:hypothetical protein